MAMNEWNFIKACAYFHDFRGVHYNDTFGESYFNVYVSSSNGNIKSADYGLYDNESLNQYLHLFEKEQNDKYKLDDYYVYVGTDKSIDTTPSIVTPLYIPPGDTEYPEGEGDTGDLFETLDGFWATMGIKSFASRVVMSLFIMLLVAILMVGASFSAGVPLNPIIVLLVEFFLMILLTYLKLLDWWIPLIIGIIGVAGMIMLAVRNN
jgi:hypothetical protein